MLLKLIFSAIVFLFMSQSIASSMDSYQCGNAELMIDKDKKQLEYTLAGNKYKGVLDQNLNVVWVPEIHNMPTRISYIEQSPIKLLLYTGVSFEPCFIK
jgi:hypothetical protein